MKNTCFLIIIVFLLLSFLTKNIWFSEQFSETEMLTPDAVTLKAQPSAQYVKLSWLKPNNSNKVLKYYIIVSSDNHPFDEQKSQYTKIYTYESMNQSIEYYIYSLIENITYNINVISEDEYGNLSKVSNTEKVKLIYDLSKVQNNKSDSEFFEAARGKRNHIKHLQFIPPQYHESLDTSSNFVPDNKKFEYLQQKIRGIFNDKLEKNSDTIQFKLV